MNFQNKLRFLILILAAQFCMTSLAQADVNDDKPWDWASEDQIPKPRCDEQAEKHGQPNLKCTIDHASWDQFLKTQLKIVRVDARSLHKPGDTCDNFSVRMIADTSGGGIFPGYGLSPADTEKLAQEFRNKVTRIDCRMDLKAPDAHLDYDAKTKTLIVFVTPSKPSAVDYMQPELIRLSKIYFPELKAWYVRHSKI